MIVHWIVDGVQVDMAGNYRSGLATNRYRAILPVLGLRELGHRVDLIEMSAWEPNGCPAESQPDVVVVGKLLPSPRFEELKQRLLAGIDAVRNKGIKLLADINDDHFDSPLLGPLWKALVTRADGVVAGSEAMAEVIRSHTSVPVHVVGDPVGSPLGEPQVFRPVKGLTKGLQRVLEAMGHGRHSLRLAWFGTHGNWPSMAGWIRQLGQLARRQPWQLTVISRPGMGIEEFVSGFNAAPLDGAMLEFVPWEEETVWEHVSDAHMVLIPSDLSHQGKAVKSANRLVDALHCGRFVIASPVPAYESFDKFAWLGDDPLAGIEWGLAHADEVLEMIRHGQERVVREHSKEAIAHQWAGALSRFSEVSLVSPVSTGRVAEVDRATDSMAVRLNLGCGDKILEGYVNVDVAPSRAGKAPDVLCDLRDLGSNFAYDSADEILSVHVIEHFWRWEVEDLLRGWVRVLKPGGRLILECPNLLSACQTLLDAPEEAAQADARGRMSMWVFYGDPAWRDPLMCHRWGYTPTSLSTLLESIGLVNVRQEPARFKMREPRDMRIVGEKGGP